MGNVTSLTRSGERDNNHYGTIDILGYSYDGNQVVKVSDKESGPHFKGAFHFVDGANEDITSTQRYKYNGKELDRMFGLDWYDYGARMYDPCMIRWNSLDPLCEKYYSVSPYAYCANDPINSLEKDRMYIYMLFYVNGYSRIGYEGDEDFKAAAYTRKADIENSKWFNKQRDIVIMSEINNFADLSHIVKSNIANNKKYGKTKEVGIWSHAGYDGPIGSVNSSDDDIIGSRQLSVEGWGKIDFNWAANAAIGFYGCKTAEKEEKSKKIFAKSVSMNGNMKNVNVYGQPSSSAFSMYQYEAKENKSTLMLHDKDYYYPRLYQIATKFYTVFWKLNSEVLRMKLYRNGKKIR